MISLLAAITTAALVISFELCERWWQRRKSLQRRRALEQRFRHDAVRYHREIFEGRITLPLHPGTPWYEQPDEMELMRSHGITFEDVQKAMRELSK